MDRLIQPDGETTRRLLPAPANGSLHLQAEERPVDLVWLWSVGWKRRWWIVLAILTAVLPTTFYVTMSEPVYRSTVTIQVNPEAAKVLPYKDVSEGLVNSTPNFDLYMKTQDELLRSKMLKVRVAERLRADGKTAGREDRGELILDDPQITRIEGSQIIKLSYLAPDPKLAAAVANTWADEFIRLHLELRYQTSKKATEFLQQQLAFLKAKVEESEGQLINYARSHQMLNIDDKQENVVRRRFGYFDSELARSEKDYISRQAELDSLKAVTVDAFPDSLKDPTISSQEARVFAAEQELAKMLSQFGENWPAVVQKKSELAVVKEQLAQAKRAAVARARKQAEMRFSSAKGEYDMLKRTLDTQASLVNRLNQASIEYNSLKRDFESNEQLYQGLLQRLKETGVSAGLEFGNLQVADKARPESEPFRPRKVLSMAMALILGLTFGVGISLGKEYMDRTVKDPWEVEHLGVPLLGWVPKTMMPAGRSLTEDTGHRSHILLPSPVEDKAIEVSLTKSQLRARESFRTLCVSIMLSRPGGPPRVLLVSSAIPKEGKTTTTSSLGISFAEMGCSTLLIDADCRSQALSRSFGVQRPAGLSTYLAGGPLAICETSVPNLSILPSGQMPPNPAALFNSKRFEELLIPMLEQYKFVLIDGPPVLSAAEVGILAAKSNGVIFVVRAESTPRDVIKKALGHLARTGATIIGGTVNYVDLKNPEYSHYGNYYYDEKVSSENFSH